jgi:GTP pyrophosphokinase
MAIEALPEKDGSALRVSLADKLYNARAMLRDYYQLGDELWGRFNVGRDGQLEYYRQLAGAFGVLTDSSMANELADVVRELERAVGGSR